MFKRTKIGPKSEPANRVCVGGECLGDCGLKGGGQRKQAALALHLANRHRPYGH